MRIISGKFKGFSLFHDRSDKLRPTQDRVKESLFNILGDTVDGARVCDLCCGAGSLGLEAFSRGAKEVVLVDKFIKTVYKNLEKLNLKKSDQGLRLIKSDVRRFIKQEEGPFSLIFFDPPYMDLLLYKTVLNLIAEQSFLTKEGLCVVELQKKTKLDLPAKFTVVKDVKYGTTRLLFLKYS